MQTKITVLFIVLWSMLLIATAQAADDAKPTPLRYGVLPVLQALPLFVADELGYFNDAGLAVELIPFNTAADKGIALSAGVIDGDFGDLFTPIFSEANSRDIMIVAMGYETAGDGRMFCLLGRPDGPYATTADLAGVPVAISSNSVIDYITAHLLADAGVDDAGYTALEMKNIGLRLQMLIAGEVEAATLPEPLASAALLKGAVLLADDSGMAASLTTLTFTAEYAAAHPQAVRTFLAAIAEANLFINEHPVEAREIMLNRTRMPEPLQASYPLPQFPAVLVVPDAALVAEALDWLMARDALDQRPAYGDLVSAEYLPVVDVADQLAE